ncbi:MAG: aspartate aminotransferase family protein [Thermoplasmata archaeon]|nr:aspartate aminotransferase family protein [Thermoplasmata archaeon]
MRLARLLARELVRFEDAHPRSRELFERGRRSLLAGVPMNWMTRWAGPYPIFVARAAGARIWDVDGHQYADLCLGDTGSMFGHSPPAVVRAVRRQLDRGITTMLPSEDSVWVGAELARRFGLPYWQLAMTATDANRFAIRIAREVTGRPKILVFNGCYHGSVDETLVVIEQGRTVPIHGSIGPPVDPSITTRTIEFNDVPALERALAPQDVAAVLAEPAMTNQGIILPEPGYHDYLRSLTRQSGTLLILDETHTLCEGPGGYTRTHGLSPDLITLGKPLASGIPAAAFGMAEEIAGPTLPKVRADSADESGIGGTLSGNPLAAAAMRATLQHLITPAAYRRMIPLAKRWTAGVERTIRELGLPWHVTRLGARAEYRFRPTPPRNGGEAMASRDAELDRFLHLYALNRGILLTPFHNMALMSPSTRAADIDLHSRVFNECARELVG